MQFFLGALRVKPPSLGGCGCRLFYGSDYVAVIVVIPVVVFHFLLLLRRESESSSTGVVLNTSTRARRDKTCLRVIRQSYTKISLLSYRD